MEVGSKTDIGKRKSLNEDSYGCLFCSVDGEERGIFIVADGVGGEDRGEVASKIAVESILNDIRPLITKEEEPTEEDIKKLVRSAVSNANKEILDYTEVNGQGKMATTITMAVIMGGYMTVANVGDSRTYLVDDELHLITKDHSLIQHLYEQGELTEEDISTPRSDKAKMQEHVVTQVLGDKQEVEVDVFQKYIYDGNKILLCCDGLTDLVSDEDIKDVIDDSEGMQDSCSKLVDMANEEGGKDNITIIIVNPSDLPDQDRVKGAETIFLED